MITGKTKLNVLCLAAACWAVSAGTPLAGPFPFAPGERLTFHIRWGIIPAGKAVLEVLPPAEIDGRQAHHFVLTTQTNGFVDVFYRVRQRIDAYADWGVNRSVHFREKHVMGPHDKDARIDFDWSAYQARFTNHGQPEPPIALMPGAFDPLSIFYFARQLDLQPGAVLERPVTDGKKCKIGRAVVVRRESIRVENRVYDTYLMEPELKEVGGVFRKSEDASIQLWVTADERRIPVRIKSRVVVGSFTGDLVESVAGRWTENGPTAPPQPPAP